MYFSIQGLSLAFNNEHFKENVPLSLFHFEFQPVLQLSSGA